MNVKRAVIWMAILAATACGDDSGDEGSGNGDASVRDPACDALTYDTFGKTFMDTYCASCHAQASTSRQGAPGDAVFDTLAQIKAEKAELQRQVETEMMPFPLRGVKLPTDEERAQFVDWLDCGPN